MERPVVNSEQKWLFRTETRAGACVTVHRGRDPSSPLPASYTSVDTPEKSTCDSSFSKSQLTWIILIGAFVLNKIKLHLKATGKGIHNDLNFCNVTFQGMILRFNWIMKIQLWWGFQKFNLLKFPDISTFPITVGTHHMIIFPHLHTLSSASFRRGESCTA